MLPPSRIPWKFQSPGRDRKWGLRPRAGIAFVLVGFFVVSNYGPARATEALEGFLDAHCARCHGPKKAKGDLRIDTLSRDFKSGKDAHLWGEIIERINAGEMPPEDEPQPSEDAIAAVIAELDARIDRAYRHLVEQSSGWLRVEHRYGPAGIDATYAELLNGTADPAAGFICLPAPNEPPT